LSTCAHTDRLCVSTQFNFPFQTGWLKTDKHFSLLLTSPFAMTSPESLHLYYFLYFSVGQGLVIVESKTG
jgi:hypothetical protein